MQKFDYRSPRFTVDLPVRFSLENSTRMARCKDISVEGMKLELRDPLPLESVGTISVSYEGLAVEISARVTHCQPNCNGLRFIYETDEQRNQVARLTARLASSRSKSGPVLLK